MGLKDMSEFTGAGEKDAGRQRDCIRRGGAAAPEPRGDGFAWTAFRIIVVAWVLVMCAAMLR